MSKDPKMADNLDRYLDNLDNLDNQHNGLPPMAEEK